jgi:hypothetical protein
MEGLISRHPWVALLGWFPPIYIIGVIRTWGRPEYEVTLIDLFDIGVTAPAAPWWPLHLFNHKRREREMRRADR